MLRAAVWLSQCLLPISWSLSPPLLFLLQTTHLMEKVNLWTSWVKSVFWCFVFFCKTFLSSSIGCLLDKKKHGGRQCIMTRTLHLSFPDDQMKEKKWKHLTCCVLKLALSVLSAVRKDTWVFALDSCADNRFCPVCRETIGDHFRRGIYRRHKVRTQTTLLSVNKLCEDLFLKKNKSLGLFPQLRNNFEMSTWKIPPMTCRFDALLFFQHNGTKRSQCWRRSGWRWDIRRFLATWESTATQFHDRNPEVSPRSVFALWNLPQCSVLLHPGEKRRSKYPVVTFSHQGLR